MKTLFLMLSLSSLFVSVQAAPLADLMQSQYLTMTSLDAGENAAHAAIARGDKALKQKNLTITNKAIMPPSNEKSDYISMGPYWWPDPDKADGLPYIRKDGEINPERKKYTDHEQLRALMYCAYDLGLAYYYSEDDRYAAKLNEMIRVFFIDKKTKMNPNLQFGQFVPGHNQGRGIGIIETHKLNLIFEGIALVRGSDAWDKKTEAGMQAWAKAYLKWLQTHPYGIDERNARNNHGTCYDVQSLALYLYLGDNAGAKRHIKKYTLARLPKQIEADGSQPEELLRTKSWGYASMNLGAWVNIAVMAEKVGFDLWNYAPKKQVYLRSMFDWYLPYLDGRKAWEWKQIAPMSMGGVSTSFEQASRVYGDEKYRRAIKEQKILK